MKPKQQAKEFAELYTRGCFDMTPRIMKECSLSYAEACSLVFKCMANMGIEITYDKVKDEYLRGLRIKELIKEFRQTLKQCIDENIPIKIVLGNFKSDLVTIKEAEIGLNNNGRIELGLDLVMYEAKGSAELLITQGIEIFIRNYKITYDTHWMKYSLDYKGSLERYELNIPIVECELIKFKTYQ